MSSNNQSVVSLDDYVAIFSSMISDIDILEVSLTRYKLYNSGCVNYTMGGRWTKGTDTINEYTINESNYEITKCGNNNLSNPLSKDVILDAIYFYDNSSNEFDEHIFPYREHVNKVIRKLKSFDCVTDVKYYPIEHEEGDYTERYYIIYKSLD